MLTQFAFSTTSLNTLEQYRDIVSKEAKDKARHFGEGVYHSFKKFHMQAPFQGMKLHLNDALVKQFSIAMFEDLLRLQAYHPITKPTNYKYAAFVFKWVAKCRPIKPISDNIGKGEYDSKEYESITKANSYFALFLAFGFLKLSINDLDPAVIKELVYTATFRDIHPEQLALTFEHVEKTYPRA